MKETLKIEIKNPFAIGFGLTLGHCAAKVLFYAIDKGIKQMKEETEQKAEETTEAN